MTFQPLFPLWAVLPAFVVLLAGLSSLEIRRAGRWPRARLAAVILSLTAILGLILQPSREIAEREAPLLLLTKGFRGDTVDSLLDRHPDWQVIRTPDAAPYRKSEAMKDLVSLSGWSRRIAAISGNGLPAYAFEYFSDQHFQYFPAPAGNGFQELWLNRFTAGQPNRLQGAYRPGGVPVQLVLRGPAGSIDSVIVDGRATQPFSLTFTPREAGNWTCQLLVKDSTGQPISENDLPLVVLQEKQLRVLILQAFPSFEVRYLKDFLADRGQAVAVRTQTSRNNYRTELANLSGLDLGQLNTTLLENFDLLIADASAFDQIGRSELKSLADAVDNGLGFLGLVTSESTAFRSWLGLAAIAQDLDTTRLTTGLSLPAYPVRTLNDRDWYPVHQTTSGSQVAAYTYRGKGKIGFQTAQESYAYLLRGDSLVYASLWMPVLEGTLREEYLDYTIEIISDFPFLVGEPVDFRVTANQPLKEVYADGVPVPMQEDYALNDIWYGRTWPNSKGWHRIEVGSERMDYYAFPDESWTSLVAAKKRRYSLIHAVPKPALLETELQIIERQAISRVWWYLLFLLSAGFLWLAPKL